MRWDMGQRSRNVEDRRGMGGPVIAGGAWRFHAAEL